MDNQEKLLVIEERFTALVAKGWRTDVEAFKAELVALAATVEGHDMSAILPQITMMLAQLQAPEGLSDIALDGVNTAHDFGETMVTNSLESAHLKVPVSAKSVKAVSGFDQLLRDALEAVHQALQMPMPSGGVTGLLSAVNPVLKTPNQLELATAWAINNASNEAVYSVAKKRGISTVWISERDACVHCTAYAGVRSTDQGYPSDLTYGSKPLKQESDFLEHPPLHPRCRCMIETNITDEYAAALHREGIRSILKGVAMPSESDKVRVAAAEQLLATHPDGVPATVVKYAKTHVKNGTFK